MGPWNLHPLPQARRRVEQAVPRLLWGSCRNSRARLGPESDPCSILDQARQWCDQSWEAVGSPGTGLLLLQWKVRPHVSLLSFHYIQIRSVINFIKSKQSWSENGASRQSCGGLGRRNRGEQGRLWLQQWKGQEVEGGGRGFPAGFSISRDPTTFIAICILLKLCQHGLAPDRIPDFKT